MFRDHNRLVFTRVVRQNLSKHTLDALNLCSITYTEHIIIMSTLTEIAIYLLSRLHCQANLSTSVELYGLGSVSSYN